MRTTVSYHIVDLRRQNRFKVGTDKRKLNVKMQLVSDDDVRKRLLEELANRLQDKRPHGQKATDKRPPDKRPQLPIYAIIALLINVI